MDNLLCSEPMGDHRIVPVIARRRFSLAEDGCNCCHVDAVMGQSDDC